jgi:hypothetical protein
MTYQVKIKDYYNAFSNADDFAFANSSNGSIPNSIIKDWRECFPTVTLAFPKWVQSNLNIGDFQYAEFDTEEDFTLFMLRWA